MGAKASIQALKRVNLTPDDIDVIIWAGEVHAEHPLVVNGIKLQQLLGNPLKSWAFDVNQRCGTFLVGLLMGKCLIQVNPEIKRVLVVSGYRNCDLINYKNPRSRFMISLAASGVAAVIRGDYNKNIILGISAITDGRFVDFDEHIVDDGEDLVRVPPQGFETAMMRKGRAVVQRLSGFRGYISGHTPGRGQFIGRCAEDVHDMVIVSHPPVLIERIAEMHFNGPGIG